MTSTATGMVGSDDDLQALGRPSRKLIKTIQKLDELQIQSTVPSLPKFVIVGDQSAGKSSIIEALCDISLPRNEATCTRCPFQITTTSSKDGGGWICVVTLQQSYKFDPTIASTGTFEQWHVAPHQTFEFATLHDKTQLAPLLLRAQQAILSPATPPSAYLSANAPDLSTTQLPFSPNLVCLDISGPELPDMSFYDLPGTIVVHQDNRQQHLVQFVERLVKSYIQDEKALILLACAADQDMEVSTTFSFVRQCQAQDRCLGVLTKADLVISQRLERIQRILGNEAFSLRLGWYITKQLSQSEILQGVSHAQARVLEKQFFSKPPWSTLSPTRTSCLGIDSLQDAISARLTEHILNALPEIIGRVQARLQRVDADLRLFGERDANPILTVRDVIRNIRDSVRDHVKGRVNRKAFDAQFGEERVKLRKALEDHAPLLEMATPGHVSPGFTIEVSEDVDTAPATPTPREPTAGASTPNQTTVGGLLSPVSSAKRKAEPAPIPVNKRARSAKNADPCTLGAGKLRLTLDVLEDVVKTYGDNSLMVQGTSEVNNILIIRALSCWNNPLDTALDSLRRLISGILESIAREKLQRYRATRLYSATLIALRDFTSSVIDAGFQQIRRLLEREQFKASTSQKLREFNQSKKLALDARRLAQRKAEAIDDEEKRRGELLSKAERRKKRNEGGFLRALGPDPYASYIDAFSLPLAYYSLAAARFNDSVFQHVDFDLLKTVHDDIGDVLMARLDALNANACAKLLIEDPAREREREALIAERGRLDLAMVELNGLPSIVENPKPFGSPHTA